MSIAVFNLEMPRSAFPDDETYEKAVESSKTARNYGQVPTDIIDISGLDKCEVLFALYEAKQPIGMGLLAARDDITLEDVRAVFGKSPFPYVDYMYGRPMKVDLDGDTFDGRLYDRDSSPGQARRIVEALRR
jgi:hypothetical protein